MTYNWEDDYIDGIHRKTDFKENGFGIDPHGCGCTDCIIGYAFNEGDYRINTAISQGRVLYNRTYGEYLLPNGVLIPHRGTYYPNRRHCPGCNCSQGQAAW